jgi:hypothetical protein
MNGWGGDNASRRELTHEDNTEGCRDEEVGKRKRQSETYEK